jgi:hypothetical protein
VTRIYTKTVTATQWTGDNADELTELMGAGRFDPHGAGENDDDPDARASFRDDHRGGGWRPLTTGDWILRDDAGDWHVCPDERFAATYKPAATEDRCFHCGDAIRLIDGAWKHRPGCRSPHDATPAS